MWKAYPIYFINTAKWSTWLFCFKSTKHRVDELVSFAAVESPRCLMRQVASKAPVWTLEPTSMHRESHIPGVKCMQYPCTL